MKLKRKLYTVLVVAIVFAVMFVGGIPAIILGASNEIAWLMMMGIICTVLGFYGTPLLFVYFGVNLWLISLQLSIVEDKILSVQDLSMNLNKQPEEIQKGIQKLISNRYIKGYTFNGNELEFISRSSEDLLVSVVCPSCGAIGYKQEDAKRAKCEHCGTIY